MKTDNYVQNFLQNLDNDLDFELKKQLFDSLSKEDIISLMFLPEITFKKVKVFILQIEHAHLKRITSTKPFSELLELRDKGHKYLVMNRSGELKDDEFMEKLDYFVLQESALEAEIQEYQDLGVGAYQQVIDLEIQIDTLQGEINLLKIRESIK